MAEARRASRRIVDAQLLGRHQAGAQDLQHHRALQQRVVGQVDHAAASGAQPADDFVMFNRLALHLDLVSVYRWFINAVSTGKKRTKSVISRRALDLVPS